MPRPFTAAGRAAAGTLFGSLARAFDARPLHPRGVAFAAEIVVEQPRLRGARLFARPGRRPALVRFSRGFGLPRPAPDLVAMAIKVPDANGPGRDQDLLLAAAGERPVLRHLFAWGGTHLERSYSTVLPFRVGARTMLLGAAPLTSGEADLDDLPALAARGELAFALRAATPLGAWHDIARLEVGSRLSEAEEEALDFNSSRSGGGIEPVGLVNRVRDAAYSAAAHERGALASPQPWIGGRPSERSSSGRTATSSSSPTSTRASRSHRSAAI
jgi:hypothetical protein